MRPVGWRYESHRHALAARGVRTRYNVLSDNEQLRSFTNKQMRHRDLEIVDESIALLDKAIAEKTARRDALLPTLEEKRRRDEGRLTAEDMRKMSEYERIDHEIRGFKERRERLEHVRPGYFSMKRRAPPAGVPEEILLEGGKATYAFDWELKPGIVWHMYNLPNGSTVRYETVKKMSEEGEKKEYYARKFDPMRPVETDAVPEGPGWQAERKWDGTRMMAVVGRDKADLINRRQVDKTRVFPELQDIGKGVSGSAVFDGEVIVPWKRGESFKLLSEREHLKDDGRISELSREHPARYIAFDLLESGGRSTTDLPLSRRRGLLRGKIRQDGRLREVVTASKDLEGFTKRQKALGAEGVVFKRAQSRYVPGKKSKDWLKLKFKRENDVVVDGYTLGTGKRAGKIGALRISAGGTSRGKVGTGFDDAENIRLKRMLDAGRHPVIRVKYRDVGSRGAYREPVYVGLRSDIKHSEAN